MEREFNHSSLSRAETKNGWSYISTQPIRPHGVSRDNFNFTFMKDENVKSTNLFICTLKMVSIACLILYILEECSTAHGRQWQWSAFRYHPCVYLWSLKASTKDISQETKNLNRNSNQHLMNKIRVTTSAMLLNKGKVSPLQARCGPESG